MQSETIDLIAATPGTRQSLVVQRFGVAGARPKIYLQAALHADELPGTLVLHHLRERLLQAEAEGRIQGEIVLVPCANPLGLAQHVLGMRIGRFALDTGGNFNRDFPALGIGAARRLEGRIGSDEACNRDAVRAALREELASRVADTPSRRLKQILLGLALDADVVLDLHCDSQALMHLYTLTPLADACEMLARLLGARAVLLAIDSGDMPFDEACSLPWYALRQRFVTNPLSLACLAVTIELRGEADVDHTLARGDADALLAFLTLRGAVAGPAIDVPSPQCVATPLAGSEPIIAPVGGVIAFHRSPGDLVRTGDAIADILDPMTAQLTTLRTTTDGLMYARCSTRLALPGTRIAKVAGTTLKRSGKLLSD